MERRRRLKMLVGAAQLFGPGGAQTEEGEGLSGQHILNNTPFKMSCLMERRRVGAG